MGQDTFPIEERFVPQLEESLEFYAVTRDGTLHTRELSRFMERTNPQWWLRTTGLERQAFWDKVGRTLIARYVKTTNYTGRCRPADIVTVQHLIQHGHRPRAGREPEYGFLDTISVRRGGDELVADFQAHTVWMDLVNAFVLATTAPAGLEHMDEELPAVPSIPSLEHAEPLNQLSWTLRESDVNGHVALLSYLERAENAVADLAGDFTLPVTWEAWFRSPSFAGERTDTLVHRESPRTTLVGFVGTEDQRVRAVARLTTGVAE